MAYYPYNVTTDRYTGHHAWQYTSNQRFSCSYGGFDASTLYDNYYTGGLNKNAVITNSDTHHVDKQAGTTNEKKSDMGAEKGNGGTVTSSNEDYAQNGVFTANTTLNIRTAPSINANIVGSYAPGESLIYDHVFISDKYVWLRYVSYSGQYHYVCAGVNGGEEYGTRQAYSSRTYTVHSGDTLSGIAKN